MTLLPNDLKHEQSVMKRLKKLTSGQLRQIKIYCSAILAERQNGRIKSSYSVGFNTWDRMEKGLPDLWEKTVVERHK